MSFDAVPGLLADLLQEQRITNDRLATVSAGLAAAIKHAYEIKAAREAREASEVAAPVAPVAPVAPIVDTPKARRKSGVSVAAGVTPPDVKAAAPTATAPAETPAEAPIPAPATPPAQVKPNDVEADRARLISLSASIDGGRSKALELIRRDDPAAKFDALPAARRAEILAALETLTESA